jgi:ribosomal protein S16
MEPAQTVELLKAAKTLCEASQDAFTPWIGVIGAIGGAIAAIVPNALMAKISSKERANSAKLQIYAEIKSTLEVERHRAYGENLSKVVASFKAGAIQRYSYKVEVTEDRFPIYKANLQNLGLLNPLLQVKIVRFYQIVEAIVQDIKPGGLLNAAPVGVEPFEEVAKLLVEAKSIGTSILAEIEGEHPNVA